MSDLPVRPNGATLPVPCTTVIPPPDYQGAMNKWTQHQLPNLELCIAFLNGEEADRLLDVRLFGIGVEGEHFRGTGVHGFALD